jgi:predicted outer membrane repeat protein
MFASQPITVRDSTFDSNDAWIGGGISSIGTSITMTHSTFKNNTAGYGGAIDTYSIQATGSDFLNNRAMNRGGGLFATYVTLSGGRFISNTASSVAGIGCGGVCVGGNPDAANTLFAGNQASGGAALQLAGSQCGWLARH